MTSFHILGLLFRCLLSQDGPTRIFYRPMRGHSMLHSKFQVYADMTESSVLSVHSPLFCRSCEEVKPLFLFQFDSYTASAEPSARKTLQQVQPVYHQLHFREGLHQAIVLASTCKAGQFICTSILSCTCLRSLSW